MNRDEIRRRVEALGEWFQNIDLRGVPTAPGHFLGDYPRIKWERFRDTIPADLAGRSVLDIGCNAGFYCIEMKRRGAARVVGIDPDPHYLAQARFAAEVCGQEIEFRQLSVYDVALLGETFDLVLFLGVFYHLRHPLLALDLIHEHAARDLLVFQSMLRGSDESEPLRDDYPIDERAIFERPGFPKLFFVEKRYASDPTNWSIPNRAAAEAMLRSAGFVILDRPEHEIFICRRAPLARSQAVCPALATAPARSRAGQAAPARLPSEGPPRLAPAVRIGVPEVATMGGRIAGATIDGDGGSSPVGRPSGRESRSPARKTPRRRARASAPGGRKKRRAIPRRRQRAVARDLVRPRPVLDEARDARGRGARNRRRRRVGLQRRDQEHRRPRGDRRSRRAR